VAGADGAQELQALDVGEPEVENDEARLARQQLQRHLAVERLDHLVAVGAQSHAQELADGRLVVDDQDAQRGGAQAAVSRRAVCTGTGSRMVKTAPVRSVRLAAVMVPCIASTKPRDMASPRPVPASTWSPLCARENLSNTCSSSARGVPAPPAVQRSA